MVNFLYNTLEAIGFAHPLHPGLTHIPMGMVIGCFFFGLTALVTKKAAFTKSAFHCSVVGLLFIVPTIVAGFLDWQYFFGSTMSIWVIIKFVLAFVLTVLLAYAVFLNLKGGTPKQLFVVYALCLACAGGLGFSGGELIYGG